MSGTGFHISVDEGLGLLTIIGHSIDVNTPLLLIPIHIRMERSHLAMFKGKLIHLELGMCRQLFERIFEIGISRCLSSELN